MARDMEALLAESYLHRWSPFLVRFTDDLGIRWYGLAYLAGFLIAWLLLGWLARTGRSRLSPRAASDFLIYGVLGVVVGGRLGYCFFYEPHLLWDPPLIGIVQIWRGGMSSHGGFLGVTVATILFCRRYSLSALHVLDVGVLVCPPGLGLGRFANFINAELWGKPLSLSSQGNPPWWSIKYPEEILQPDFSHLEQLVSIKSRFAIEGPLPGAIADAVRSGDEQIAEAVRPLLTAHYPSQIFQALTDGPILFAIMVILWLFPLKPGCASGVFLVSYGLMRIATEVFRQPDAGVSLLSTPLGDLSRGQVFSVLMVIAGVAMITVCARRKAPVMGCLRKSLLREAEGVEPG